MVKRFAGAVFCMIVAARALADGEAYVAADVGQTRFADACAAVPAGWSCTGSSTARRLAIGASIHRMFGVEASYTDLGKGFMSGLAPVAAGSAGRLTAVWKATALQFSAIGVFPVNGAFSAIARLGLVSSLLQMTGTFAGAPLPTRNAPNTSLSLGIGGQFRAGKGAAIRVQYERLGTFGDAMTTGTTKVRLLSAGLVFRF